MIELANLCISRVQGSGYLAQVCVHATCKVNCIRGVSSLPTGASRIPRTTARLLQHLLSPICVLLSLALTPPAAGAVTWLPVRQLTSTLWTYVTTNVRYTLDMSCCMSEKHLLIGHIFPASLCRFTGHIQCSLLGQLSGSMEQHPGMHLNLHPFLFLVKYLISS